tara:strand:- start:117 stop:515 length:399 start_codon:yes stop_codon:yes gene_type:complete
LASYKQSEVSNLKKETDLYRELKRKIPKISWNRLENRSLLGTPDLLAYSINEHFFTLELKLTFANKIRFSPHQIAFHVKHRKNTFILVACTPDRGLVRLYPGHQILELVNSGLKLEPLCAGWDACALELERL